MSTLRNSYQNIAQGLRGLKTFGFWLSVVLGFIKSVSDEVKFGHNPALASGVITDIWEYGATQPVYVFPDTGGETVEILGLNAADTDIPIVLHGLDENGLAQTEEVTTDGTDGTTPVPSTKTWTSVHRAYNDGGVNLLGNVIVRGDGSTSANVFALVSTDDQQTSQTPYIVPSNKVAVIMNYSTAINKTGATASCIFALKVAKVGKVFRTAIRYGLQSTGTSNISSDLIIPVLLGPGTRVKVTGVASASSVDVSAEYSMALVDKDSVSAKILAALL